MANYNVLKAAIEAAVYPNGRQEVDGTEVQTILKGMVDALGSGYTFAGIATPTTATPTTDARVFYLATEQGRYFNAVNISDGELGIITYDGSITLHTAPIIASSAVTAIAEAAAEAKAEDVIAAFKAEYEEELEELREYAETAANAANSAATSAQTQASLAYEKAGIAAQQAEAARLKAEAADTAAQGANDAKVAATTAASTANTAAANADAKATAAANAADDALAAAGSVQAAKAAALAAAGTATTAAGTANTAAAAANAAATEAKNLPYIDEDTKTWMVYNASTHEYEDSGVAADDAQKADTADLLDGSLVPAFADNLKSWAERSSVEVSDEWDAVPVRTTAGSLSVNTAEGAHLISIKSSGKFTATVFKASPFNLIITSQLVGGKPYILVPKGTFGTFGTADENNGVLLTASNGTNKKVTLRFKAYADGVPTSLTDGIACPYQDVQGYRFYLPPSAGYLFGSDIATNDCAHMAWSKDYDKYEAAATFASISFSSIINKFTAIGGTYFMLAVRKGGDIVQDAFEYYNSKFNYTKNCGYDATAWTTTEITDEEGTTIGYHHEKTISAMALNGACEDYAGLIDINVNGKTIWYDDDSQTASVAVKYELETPATGTVSVGNSYQPNDMGLEYIEGMIGDATIVTTYMQGLPDELAALPSKVTGIKADVERELAELGATTEGLAETIDKLITAKLMVALNLERHYLYRGKPLRTYGIGYHTIKPTFGTAATISFSYKVNAYAFVFDVELTATDDVFTFREKFKAALTASLSYLGVVPSVTLLDDGSGINVSTDTDIEVEINTVACTGATLAEVSDHPVTAPAFIGQLYHNTNKKKEWEGKSVLSASDWVAKY